jgi:hypothetical protein
MTDMTLQKLQQNEQFIYFFSHKGLFLSSNCPINSQLKKKFKKKTQKLREFQTLEEIYKQVNQS